MSIAARVGQFSRSFRSLIKTRADMAKTIKDLKDLRAFCVWAAIDIKVLQTLRERATLFAASRGGLSPAIFSYTVVRGPVPRDLSITAAWRGTGPRPTIKRAVLATVARGPVPRDRFRLREGFPRDRCMARDRPSPYGKTGRSSHPANLPLQFKSNYTPPNATPDSTAAKNSPSTLPRAPIQ